MLMKRFCAFLVLLYLVTFMAPGVRADDSEISFAFQDRIGSVIPIVAVNKGYFAGEGLNVRPFRFSSGPACAEALYSGAASIGAMGDTTAIITVSRTERFVIIGSHASGEHRHRIMVPEGSPIKDFSGLRGKRLAVKKGTSTYGGVLAALDKAGIDPTELQIINLTPPVMADALAAGSIDAFAASEPTPSVAESRGAREVATLGGLDNEYPIMFLAKRTFIQERSDDMEKFMRAMRKAEKFASEHPDEAAMIMSQETGLPLVMVKKAMKLHSYRLRLDDSIKRSLIHTSAFLVGQGLIAEEPDFEKVSDGKFLE